MNISKGTRLSWTEYKVSGNVTHSVVFDLTLDERQLLGMAQKARHTKKRSTSDGALTLKITSVRSEDIGPTVTYTTRTEPTYKGFGRMDEAVEEARDWQYIVFMESIATGTKIYFVIDALKQIDGRKYVIMQSPKKAEQSA